MEDPIVWKMDLMSMPWYGAEVCTCLSPVRLSVCFRCLLSCNEIMYVRDNTDHLIYSQDGLCVYVVKNYKTYSWDWIGLFKVL